MKYGIFEHNSCGTGSSYTKFEYKKKHMASYV